MAEMKDVAELISVRRVAPSGEGRRIRRAAGLTQVELAEAVGVDASAIGRWEGNHGGGSRKNIARYAEVVARAAEVIGEIKEGESDDNGSDQPEGKGEEG